MTAKRTGGRILVDNLVAQGCDRIFHVPGESFLAVLDALHDVPAIDVVTCRQEGGVGFMACADGAMTGRPGIAFVTRGPGATNASIGVHVAMQDSQPMILFVGDVDRGMRDREGFQEIDLPAMFAPLAKWATRIEDARRIPEYVARAWAVATSGRPGPVVIALPEDMLCDAVEALDRPALAPPLQSPDFVEVDMLYDELRKAKRPVAIVGGAGWDGETGEEFARFAERIGLPVAGAFRRQDAIPNSSPAWAGNLGYGPNPKLVQRIREADLLLVVGARLCSAFPIRAGRWSMSIPIPMSSTASIWRTCRSAPAPSNSRRRWRPTRRSSCPVSTPRPRTRNGANGPPPRRATASPSTWANASRRCARQCRRTRSSATAPAISQAGGTATGPMARSLRSLLPPPARWAMACPPRSPPRCASRSARWSRSRAMATS